MNIHHGVKSQGGLSSMLNKAFSHHHRFKTRVWGTGVLRKLSYSESEARLRPFCHSQSVSHRWFTGVAQSLIICVWVKEVAKLQQLFLTLSVWPERRVPSYRISLSRGWTVYTNGQRAYHPLCFCYICGLAKWLQFQKAQHKPGLTNTGVGGMLYLYSRVLPWGVSSLTALPCWQSALSNKYLGSKQAAVNWTEPCVTSSCTRADLGTTPEFLGES